MASKYATQYDDEMLENKNKQIAAVNDITAKNKQTITDNYAAQLKEAETAYDDQERVNAVQKLINERQVAESMANAGLTNSGLNRTQQTAVQLSYANNKAKLDRQRQSTIDALNREMASYISQADTKAASDIASIEDTYAQNRQSYVSAMEKADIDAETQRLKDQYDYNLKLIEKQQEAESKTGLYTYGYAKKNANDKVEYRVFEIDGETKKVADGHNPYNRENNKVKYAYEAKNYGFFSNGYQPKGVKGHGKFVGAVGEDNIYGKSQSVWQAEDGTLWYWNGRNNEYELYDLNGDGKSDALDAIALKKG